MGCCDDGKKCCGISYKSIPAAMGDDTGEYKPENGAYYNTLIRYEANGALYFYTNDGIWTQLDGERFFVMIEEYEREANAMIDQRFDDLDVQEEINNKLDEMAEDGTLQEIITAYIQSNVEWTFDTVSDMKSATNLVSGSYARTLGFHSLNDGGGALYKITSTGTANEMDIIAVGSLFANLIEEDVTNIKKYGAKADASVDISGILNRIETLGKTSLYIPNGEYLLSSRVTLNTCKDINGQSTKESKIYAPNGFITWNDDNRSYRHISKLTIDGQTADTNVCFEGSFTFCKVEDVNVTNFDIAYKIGNSTWINEFTNLIITDCNYGFYNGTSRITNDNAFYNCSFQHLSTAFHIAGNVNNFVTCNFEFCDVCFDAISGRDWNIDNCYIENNGIVFNITRDSYNSSIVVNNCWLMALETGASNGWLAKINTYASVNNETASLLIQNSYIQNKTANTLKPFAFQGENAKTYWGVSLDGNRYENIKTPDQYYIYYDDLFDLTLCPNYASPSNSITFKSDLPLYKYQGITWYQLSNGNMRGYGRTNSHIKMIGKYSASSTAGSLTITPDKPYGLFYPTISYLPVTVRFTDGTYDIARLDITMSNLSVTAIPYNSRTLAEVIFNNEYGDMI